LISDMDSPGGLKGDGERRCGSGPAADDCHSSLATWRSRCNALEFGCILRPSAFAPLPDGQPACDVSKLSAGWHGWPVAPETASIPGSAMADGRGAAHRADRADAATASEAHVVVGYILGGSPLNNTGE
jgi:hypothetical protein